MPFPIADGAPSPVLDELLGGPAAALTAVALVVGPAARASGWGARAAITLGQRWRGPRRLLLADLDLANPTLHDMAGVANEEGVIDVVEYGVSIGRLIRSAGGGAYDFLPAGLYAPDPGSTLRHDGWSRVLLEVAARRGTLLAWVPSDAEGADAVVARAGAVIVLAEEDEARKVVEQLPHPYAVLAILTPEPVAAAAAGPVAGEAERRQQELIDAEPVDAEPVEAEPVDAEPVDAEPVDAEPVVPESFDGESVDAEPAVTEAPAHEPLQSPPATATDASLGAALAGAEESTDPAGGDAEAPDVGEPAADSDVARALREATDPQVPSSPAVRSLDTATEAGDDAGADSVADDAARTGASGAEATLPVEPGEGAGADADDDTFVRIRLPEDPAARNALIHELRDRQRAARLAGAAEAAGSGTSAGDQPSVDAGETREHSAAAAAGIAASGPATSDPAVPTGPPRPPHQQGVVATPAPRVRRFRRPILWTVGVVMLASLLAGAWHFLGGRLQAPPPVVAAPEPAPPPPAAPAVQNALPFVVAIEAHRDLAAALTRVADLTEMEPRLLFHIEALEREGTLFYHVMAGPVADSGSALALRDTLIARGHKTGPTPTDVRATPLAYLIGDYATEASAAEQREILRRLDIPAYVLRGEAADGEPLYRLYVGGFATEAEAGVVGQMLRAAGIRDTLVVRTGTIAGGPRTSNPDTMTDSLATRTSSSTQ